MEETQAIDFDDLPSQEEPVQADIHQACVTCVEGCWSSMLGVF